MTTSNPEIMPADQFIRMTLANDEASTDRELVDHIMAECGLTKDWAEAWVALRNKFLLDPIGTYDLSPEVRP